MPEIEYDELQDILCHQMCYVELELGSDLATLLMEEMQGKNPKLSAFTQLLDPDKASPVVAPKAASPDLEEDEEDMAEPF